MKKIVFILIAIVILSFTFKSKKFKSPEDFVFIPSGKIEMQGEIYSCNAFWMAEHEVTNGEYKFFLEDLKKNNRMGDYNAALPDTNQWTEHGGYMLPMRDHYFSHPAYTNYPVVNVSKKGAELYCSYLTEKYRSMYGDVIQNFRLPARKEWMYAAASGKNNSIYSWNGPYLRRSNGHCQANYRKVGDHNITLTENGPEVVADSLHYQEVIINEVYITAPSQSYWPNDFGLYNMCGNVAEMVADKDVAVGGDWHLPGYDIRILSEQKFDGPNPFTGFRPVLSFVSQDN